MADLGQVGIVFLLLYDIFLNSKKKTVVGWEHMRKYFSLSLPTLDSSSALLCGYSE